MRSRGVLSLGRLGVRIAVDNSRMHTLCSSASPQLLVSSKSGANVFLSRKELKERKDFFLSLVDTRYTEILVHYSLCVLCVLCCLKMILFDHIDWDDKTRRQNAGAMVFAIEKFQAEKPEIKGWYALAG